MNDVCMFTQSKTPNQTRSIPSLTTTGTRSAMMMKCDLKEVEKERQAEHEDVHEDQKADGPPRKVGQQVFDPAHRPFPCGSRPAWLLPSPGQFRTDRSPACLQRTDDGGDHRHVRASADPDSDVFGFNLDAPGIATASPDIRLGLTSSRLALMASNRDRYRGVYHRRYKLRIVSHRRRLPARLPAPNEHLLWEQPVSPGNLGNDRAWYQRLLDDPGLVALGEPTTASRLRDRFQPARRRVRPKRMVKHRHKPIPSKRS